MGRLIRSLCHYFCAALLIFACVITANLPANAQYVGKESAPTANNAEKTKSNVPESASALVTTGLTQAGPGDVTVINGGIAMKGTVKVNTLAMLEALVNIGVNGVELICLAWATGLLIAAFTMPAACRSSRLVKAAVTVCIGLMIPGSVNWLIAECRDFNLFSESGNAEVFQ